MKLRARRWLPACAALLGLAAAGTAGAQGAGTPPTAAEIDALGLGLPQPAEPAPARADAAPAAAGSRNSATLEAAVGRDAWRAETFAGEPPRQRRQRLSASGSIERRLGAGWLLRASDRIDIAWRAGEQTLDAEQVAHTLKELQLSWGSQQLFVDLGRFIERMGVAYAYNPTDLWRRHTVVARTSEDPSLARSERLGAVGLRVQWLWDGGSVVGLLAPQLQRRPGGGALSPHLERSNADTRGAVRVALRLGSATQAEALWQHDEASGSAWGANLSLLADERTVLHAEVLLTREAGIVERALATGMPEAPYRLAPLRAGWRPRAVAGATVTPWPELTLALEWHHDGTALGEAAWRDVASPTTLAGLQRYLRLREYAISAQDPLARNNLFARAALRDWPARGWGGSVLWRRNLEDRSSYHWLQLTHERGALALALTWAIARGAPRTEYGDSQARSNLQLAAIWTL